MPETFDLTEFTLEGFEDADIHGITLNLKPGTDLISRLLLQTPYIKNVIAEYFSNGKINGNMYESVTTDFPDRKKSDILYLPTTKAITSVNPPILVEIQNLIDVKFISRVIRYCLNVKDKYKISPMVIVIAVNGFETKKYREKSFIKENNYYTTSCTHWAETIKIYSLDTIAEDLLKPPMNQFIALTYFLCSQQRSILALEEWLDPNLQKIYYLANQIFKRFNEDNEDQAEVALDVCDKVELLLRKISQTNKENDKRKVEKYVESAMEFISKRRKIFAPKENEEAVTPIESIESADLSFVKEFKKDTKGKMNWKGCYEEGRKKELFDRFNSHLTLKNAFNGNRL